MTVSPRDQERVARVWRCQRCVARAVDCSRAAIGRAGGSEGAPSRRGGRGCEPHVPGVVDAGGYGPDRAAVATGRGAGHRTPADADRLRVFTAYQAAWEAGMSSPVPPRAAPRP